MCTAPNILNIELCYDDKLLSSGSYTYSLRRSKQSTLMSSDAVLSISLETILQGSNPVH